MPSRAKGIIQSLFLLGFIIAVVQPENLRALEKKLRVSSDYTHVYLQPDSSGLAIDTLERV